MEPQVTLSTRQAFARGLVKVILHDSERVVELWVTPTLIQDKPAFAAWCGGRLRDLWLKQKDAASA